MVYNSTNVTRGRGVAVATSVLLHLAVLYAPLNQYFGTVPPALGDWGILGAVLVVGLIAYFAVALRIKRYLLPDEDHH